MSTAEALLQPSSPKSVPALYDGHVQCACGNFFMPDSEFCRKCGSRRGTSCAPELDEVLNKTSRWDLFIEAQEREDNKIALAEKMNTAPRTLEIAYSVTKGENHHEIVYEDPTATEKDKGPRLLVPLQSVLSLKALCENEFNRVEVMTAVLKQCRRDYFKELAYLREQLKRVALPDYQPDPLENFEVYWYNPPMYLDEELKDYLQDCIRWHLKDLIQENFRLTQQLNDLGGSAGAGDDADILRMIGTLLPGGFVRKSYHLCSKAEKKDFLTACRNLLSAENDNEDDEEGKLRRLEKENEKLKKQLSENESLRKRNADLEAQIAALNAGPSAEKARADEQQARADELERRYASLEAEMKKTAKELEELHQVVEQLAQRIDKVTYTCDPGAKPGAVSTHGLVGPIETAVSALEGCALMDAEAIRNSKDLAAQLKAFRDQESKMKDEIARLQAEVKRLKQERDAAAAASANSAHGMSAEDLAKMRQELKALREANDRMTKELDEAFKNSQRIRELEKQLAESEEDRKRMQDQLKGSVDNDALAVAQAALEELAAKLERAQDKIRELKAEVKRLKRMQGIEDDDDSDDDSNYDGDMPMFLMSYVKRTRHITKPRWQHLSDDARFGQQRRDFIYAQAHGTDQQGVFQALSFLRAGASRNSVVVLPPSRPKRHRSPSKVLEEQREPVVTALAAHSVVNAEKSNFFADQHLQDISLRTGQPLFRFENMASGIDSHPDLEAALAFSPSSEGVQRKKRAATPQGTSSTGGTVVQSTGFQALAAATHTGSFGRAPLMVVASSDRKPMTATTAQRISSPAQHEFQRGREAGAREIVAKAQTFAKSRSRDRSCSSNDGLSPGRPLSTDSKAESRQGTGRVKGASHAIPIISANAVAGPAVSALSGRPIAVLAAPAMTAASPPSANSVQVGKRELVGAGQPVDPPAVRISSSSMRRSGEHVVTRQAGPVVATSAGKQVSSVSAFPVGALESVAASGRRLEQVPAVLTYVGSGPGGVQSHQRSRSPPAAERQVEFSTQEVEAPNDPNSPKDGQWLRTGGLQKMETPTEWSVMSRRKAPSPVRGSSPLGDERHFPASSRSRPTSQGTPSPRRTPLSSPQRRTSPKPKDVTERAEFSLDSHTGPLFPPTLADMIGYPSKATAVQVQTEHKGSSLPQRWQTSAAAPASKRLLTDPLPAELSTSTTGSGTLPAQDSITSTVGSVVSSHLKSVGSKQGLSRAPPSRGNAVSRGSVGGSLRSSLSSPVLPNSKISSPSSPMKGPSSEFSPPLGFGERAPSRASTAQSGISPMLAPVRRSTAIGGQRDVTWGSRSTGSLPLTNVAGRSANAGFTSQQKQSKRRLGSSDDKAAQAELAAANSEGHLPELLPAFKPGRIQKGPKAPAWLVAM
jgi:hypothetical protein